MATKDEYTQKQLENLGKRIKQLRKEKGITNYEHLAFMSNTSRSMISRFEGGSDLRFSTLLKVIKALGVSVEEFFKDGFDAEK
jgi:transcriptional regulator with XRE-family HTH domain